MASPKTETGASFCLPTIRTIILLPTIKGEDFFWPGRTASPPPTAWKSRTIRAKTAIGLSITTCCASPCVRPMGAKCTVLARCAGFQVSQPEPVSSDQLRLLMPEGDFFISDGYGSSYVHHFDPAGHYISSFGGTGNTPSNLNTPHAVWIDTRSGKPSLLVCDRGNEMLKWFSLSGELQQVVPVPGAQPSNVAPLWGNRSARFKNHIAIASLNGMILILDGTQRVVSVVGGEPPVYVDGKLRMAE